MTEWFLSADFKLWLGLCFWIVGAWYFAKWLEERARAREREVADAHWRHIQESWLDVIALEASRLSEENERWRRAHPDAPSYPRRAIDLTGRALDADVTE